MTNIQPTKQPPVFQTKQEEADFWDTHNVTEYAQNLTPQPVTYQLPPSH